MPLLVCATPIGNLADVTHRVLDALRDADLVLCEDTRRTQVLLDRYGIRARGLLSVHRHNEARQARELLPRLQSGETLALVSDAGLPGVNDPGGRLVEAALAAGVDVTVLPGPSAVETALVASGLGGRAVPVSRLSPRRRGRARDALEGLASVAVSGRRVRVAQAPCRHRLRPSPAVDPARRVAVCRELTKRFEEIARGSAAELAERFDVPVRGEVTVVVGPGAAPDDRLDDAVAAVRELVAAGAARRAAADTVAGLLDLSRNELYRRSLAPSD